MLETPSICRYWPLASDNLAVRTISRKGRAWNRSGILRDHMPNATREGGEDMVRPAWRHAEPGRNDLAPPRPGGRRVVTTVSVPILHARRSLEESCP